MEKDFNSSAAIEPLINVKRNKGLIFPFDNYKEGQVYVKKLLLTVSVYLPL